MALIVLVSNARSSLPSFLVPSRECTAEMEFSPAFPPMDSLIPPCTLISVQVIPGSMYGDGEMLLPRNSYFLPRPDNVKPNGLTSKLACSIPKQMVSHDTRLDGVSDALADPTKRAMLRNLASKNQSIGELAAPFTMTFPAASISACLNCRTGWPDSTRARPQVKQNHL